MVNAPTHPSLAEYLDYFFMAQMQKPSWQPAAPMFLKCTLKEISASSERV